MSEHVIVGTCTWLKQWQVMWFTYKVETFKHDIVENSVLATSDNQQQIKLTLFHPRDVDLGPVILIPVQ